MGNGVGGKIKKTERKTTVKKYVKEAMNESVKESHKWNTADTMTIIRMSASVVLIFLSPLTSLFFAVYTLAGVTDVLDGWIARKTGTVSEFGARLDSISDLMFYGVVLIRLLPFLLRTLPQEIFYVLTVILLVRLAAYITAACRYHRFASLHTWLNKLTGASVFLLPYVFVFSTGLVYSWLVCALAFASSLEELVLHLCRKQYNAEIKSIFQIRKNSSRATSHK